MSELDITKPIYMADDGGEYAGMSVTAIHPSRTMFGDNVRLDNTDDGWVYIDDLSRLTNTPPKPTDKQIADAVRMLARQNQEKICAYKHDCIDCAVDGLGCHNNRQMFQAILDHAATGLVVSHD